MMLPKQAMEYNGPVGTGPKGWKVEVLKATDLWRMKYAMDGRDSGEGPFHVLRHDGVLWMSDTAAEMRDLYEPVGMIRASKPATVLVHGLGMGLVIAAALRYGSDVDVVEIDGDLAEWMTPWLTTLAAKHGGEIRVHVGDALTWQWPVGSKWHIVWHDIWPDISDDNLKDMHYLHRSFGGRCDWQGSWARAWIR